MNGRGGRETRALTDEASMQHSHAVRRASMCRAVWDGGDGNGSVVCRPAASDRWTSNSRLETGQRGTGMAGVTVGSDGKYHDAKKAKKAALQMPTVPAEMHSQTRTDSQCYKERTVLLELLWIPRVQVQGWQANLKHDCASEAQSCWG